MEQNLSKKEELNIEHLKKMVEPLVQWYEKQARQFPWRENTDPYRVWVSEIMLQQTRISAALPYYDRFMKALPTVSALANVPDDELLKLWEGLGYYSRARNLKKAALKVMSDFNGKFPVSFQELLSLAGIGRYTAGAVASICGGEAVSAVDGNVLRVLCRYDVSFMDVLLPSSKKIAEDTINRILPKEKPGVFNEAIMELGETICLPNGEPLCSECPLFDTCLGRKTGKAAKLPIRKQKVKRRKEEKTIFIIISSQKVAIQRRGESGLLAGLWEFPNVDGLLSMEKIGQELEDKGLSILNIEPIGQTKHIFTHIEWHMTGFRVVVKEEVGPFVWVTKKELGEGFPMPSAFSYFHKKI